MPIEATYYLCEYCDLVFENRAKCVRHEHVDHPERKAIMVDASTMVDKRFLREQLCPDPLLADAIKLEADNTPNSNGDELDTGELTIASSVDDNGDFEQPMVFDAEGIFSNQHHAIEIKENDELFERKPLSKRPEYSTPTRKRELPLQYKPMKYPCSLCGKIFDSALSVHVHRKQEHFSKRHQCSRCDRTFTQAHNLRSHIETVHEHNARRFPCKVCGKNYSQMSAVYRHMRAEHFGVRWYCARCDMSFKHRETFVQHMHRIHNEPPPAENVTIRDDSLDTTDRCPSLHSLRFDLAADEEPPTQIRRSTNQLPALASTD